MSMSDKMQFLFSAIEKDCHSIKIRFYRHVERSDGCWLWNAQKNAVGYGFFRVCGTMHQHRGRDYAHRVAWMLENKSPIFPGEQINHRCNVASCVRLDHLYKGSQHENLMDASRLGKMARDVRGERHPNAKLSDAEVAYIRSIYVPRNVQLRKRLAEQFGVCPGHIYNVAVGSTRR